MIKKDLFLTCIKKIFFLIFFILSLFFFTSCMPCRESSLFNSKPRKNKPNKKKPRQYQEDDQEYDEEDEEEDDQEDDQEEDDDDIINKGKKAASGALDISESMEDYKNNSKQEKERSYQSKNTRPQDSTNKGNLNSRKQSSFPKRRS